MDKAIQAKEREVLTEAWKRTYEKYSSSELLEEADFESLCIGWCLANGLNVEEGYDFYRAMITLGVF